MSLVRLHSHPREHGRRGHLSRINGPYKKEHSGAKLGGPALDYLVVTWLLNAATDLRGCVLNAVKYYTCATHHLHIGVNIF